MKIFDDISKVNVPVLSDGQLYIYVLENSPQGNIKIGRSSNIQQRLRALSGSNSGGNHITRIAVSDATWLYTLEHLLHNHFSMYRIEGTEWFFGEDMTFDSVVEYIENLFVSDEYATCNRVRCEFVHTYSMLCRQLVANDVA